MTAKRGSQWRRDVMTKLLKKHRNRCYYCERQFKSVELTLDHKVPLSRGGNNAIGNLVPSCWPCNQEKGDRMPWEILDTDFSQEIPGRNPQESPNGEV